MKDKDERRPPPKSTDTLTYLVPKLLFSNFITDLSIKVINLRFEINVDLCDKEKVSLKINIEQQLSENGKPGPVGVLHKVDPNKPTKVTISIN